MNRRASRRDDNHSAIVKALRDAGCSVLDMADLGGGVPDLLASSPVWPHSLALLECKDGSKPPSARKLTPDQIRFHATWKGPIHVVTSPAEALRVMGIV